MVLISEVSRKARKDSQRRKEEGINMTITHRLWKHFMFLLFASLVALQTPAQESRSGQWIIDTTRGNGKYQITLSYRSDSNGHGNSTTSQRIEPDRLRGLSSAQIMSSGTQVQFQVVRDAGTFNCEGWFKDGKGSGHFVFAPSPAFAA